MIKPSFFSYWLEVNLSERGREIQMKLASQMALIANAALEDKRYTADMLFRETETTKRELQYAIGGFKPLTRSVIDAVIQRREYLFLEDLKKLVVSLIDLYLSNTEKKALLNDFKKAHELTQLAMPIKQAEPISRCLNIPLESQGEVQTIMRMAQGEDKTGFGNLKVDIILEDENNDFKNNHSIFTSLWLLHAPAIQYLSDKDKVAAEYIKKRFAE